MTENFLRKFINGLLVGAGFSVSFLLFMLVWTFTAQPRIDRIFNETYNKVRSDYEVSFINELEIEVLNYKLHDESFVINYRMKNLGASSFAHFYSVRFSVISETDEFIGNCDHEIPETYTDEEYVFLSKKCLELQNEANNDSRILVSVLRNRDQLEFNIVESKS
ncbi:hypothetical protein [Glaciecola petra]|uniref:DUF2393 domain-containing protein n=1 Tax=Glaciecola petra TaxID=3075602 RepID=A0ABU2ZSZ4_9ALTE|nr:hypothetical protein [Aestuariibacter sp. P117]MDT0595758.1 hypothetical protein [Aestuariibacter sp. P117]